MSQVNFDSCMQALEDQDYAEFKHCFSMGLTVKEQNLLLETAIINQKKIFVQYLLANMVVSEKQLTFYQMLAASRDSMPILKMLIKGKVATFVWTALFKLRKVDEIEDFLDLYGKPQENIIDILDLALANRDPKVHDLAFDHLFDPVLVDKPDLKNRLIDSIIDSASFDLLDKIPGTSDLKAVVSKKHSERQNFNFMLHDYIDFVFEVAPPRKVARKVYELDPIIEGLEDSYAHIIVEGYVANEGTSLVEDRQEQLTENGQTMLDLLKSSKLALLKITERIPREYRVKAKNLLAGSQEISLALHPCLFDDPDCVYLCYIVEQNGLHYLSSMPLFIFLERKSLFLLGLRKEQQKKQQKVRKKSKTAKKSVKKASLTSAEKFKYLLKEHVHCFREDNA